jgi:hypothetical protein
MAFIPVREPVFLMDDVIVATHNFFLSYVAPDPHSSLSMHDVKELVESFIELHQVAYGPIMLLQLMFSFINYAEWNITDQGDLPGVPSNIFYIAGLLTAPVCAPWTDDVFYSVRYVPVYPSPASSHPSSPSQTRTESTHVSETIMGPNNTVSGVDGLLQFAILSQFRWHLHVVFCNVGLHTHFTDDGPGGHCKLREADPSSSPLDVFYLWYLFARFEGM